MIPKTIFQTHEHKYEELPQHLRQIVMSWKNLNPGWNYVYHDKDQREQYVLQNGGELYDIYKRVKGPHKADIWRYLIVQAEGGVYADMDSFCTTPMDYILDNLSNDIDVVCTKMDRSGGINNANFAAVKGSVILSSCIKDIKAGWMPPDFKTTIIHKSFSDNVLNNINIVADTMVASHSQIYKKNFDLENIKIDYYGKELFYTQEYTNVL